MLLSIEHPVLLNECLVHEIVLPDESVQRRQEDPHSILLVEEAGCQVVDEVLLGVWHQQAVKIMVHKLVKCCDLFELLEHLSVTPGYREQASEVLSIATIFASLGHIDIVKGQELHQDVDITVSITFIRLPEWACWHVILNHTVSLWVLSLAHLLVDLQILRQKL